jgi:Na+-transporting methylmalonyl-CoA/oxaloacetate decarboxylase gamma subunit
LDEPALWMLSISAFTAVMLLLAVLAVAIRLLTLAFAPPAVAPATAATAATATAASSDAVDPHVLAAIHAAVQQRLPGGRVTHVAALPHEAPRGESAR